MSRPTLADMLAQQRTPIPIPVGDIMSSTAGWPRRIPLVDNRGFLITLVPKGTSLYREIERGCAFNGVGHWFQVRVYQQTPISDTYVINTSVEDVCYHTFDIKVLEVGTPTVDTPTLNLVAVVAHFRDELIADPKIPDLRDQFR